MALHSSTLAWKIPWTEEPGGLQSMGSHRVGCDWMTSLSRTGEGNGSPLQCSCLENPRDGGAWWAAVYGVAQSRTRLKRLSSSSSSKGDPNCTLSFLRSYGMSGASQVVLVVKNPPANSGDVGLRPGPGGSPKEGNGNLLQYSCLENSMDRGAWWAAVHGVTKRVRHGWSTEHTHAWHECMTSFAHHFAVLSSSNK